MSLVLTVCALQTYQMNTDADDTARFHPDIKVSEGALRSSSMGKSNLANVLQYQVRCKQFDY